MKDFIIINNHRICVSHRVCISHITHYFATYKTSDHEGYFRINIFYEGSDQSIFFSTKEEVDEALELLDKHCLKNINE